MIVCAAENCVMPGRFVPVLNAPPAPHWGDHGRRVQLKLCFCPIHRDLATVDALFTAAARRAMDEQFIAQSLPVPDWTRATLEFQIVGEQMPEAKSA